MLNVESKESAHDHPFFYHNNLRLLTGVEARFDPLFISLNRVKSIKRV